MADFTLIVTDAGREAIVNASNTGTLPVAISQIALGSGRWSPDATATALQAEIKRIDTVGGQAVAEDTIHITVTDDSADAYSLGEFGLYTDSGVLFAIYSDAVDGITDKASDALLLLAADVVLTSVPPNSVTVNGAGFSNPQATESLAGVAEIATQAETDAGVDDSRVVTPKKLMGSATSAPTATYLVRRDLAGRAKVAAPSAADDIARKDTVDNHAALTAPHSATSAASPNRLMLRDSAGRAKVATPSAADDIARKDTVDTHAALTAPHSATSAASANRLMLRDSVGRAKVAAPSASDDIARKDTVDAHAALTSPHGATSAASANRLMWRDSAGRAKVATPFAADDIARKDTVDAVQQDLSDHAGQTAAHGATSSANAYTIMRRDWAGRSKAAAPNASDDIARKYEVDCAAPPGMVAHFARSSAPTGWLVADGRPVSRSGYSELYAAIGTTFGSGDGSTTFNLPDLRGEFIRGLDLGRNLDPSRGFGTVQSHAVERFTGSLGIHVQTQSGYSSLQNGVLRFDKTTSGNSSGGNSAGTISIDAARQINTASETRPRNIALLPCIKT